MGIYFSAQNCAFYNDAVIDVSALPSDAVAVSDAAFSELMAAQAAGKVIAAGSDGKPVAVEQSCGSCHCTLHELVKATKETLGHVKVDGETIVSDDGVISATVDISGKADKGHTHEIADVNSLATNMAIWQPNHDYVTNDVIYVRDIPEMADQWEWKKWINLVGGLVLISYNDFNSGTTPVTQVIAENWDSIVNRIGGGIGNIYFKNIDYKSSSGDYNCWSVYSLLSFMSFYSVHTKNDETIAGTKTFSAIPQIPTAAAGDSSANAASTEFVTGAMNGIDYVVEEKLIFGSNISNYSWYRRYKSGRLEQGGRVYDDVSGGTKYTNITFPVAFGSGDNYSNVLNYNYTLLITPTRNKEDYLEHSPVISTLYKGSTYFRVYWHGTTCIEGFYWYASGRATSYYKGTISGKTFGVDLSTGETAIEE